MVSGEMADSGLIIREKKKLYVGCALTDAPQEFVDEVEALKGELAVDWEVLRFLGVTAGSAGDVYNQDINVNVRNCDGFVGVADYGATGLGWELGVADERRTPTLIVTHAARRISRLPIGAPVWRNHIEFRTYENLVQDVPEIVRDVFADILSQPAMNGPDDHDGISGNIQNLRGLDAPEDINYGE